MSRRLENFEPINPPNVGIYTCGPTVYDYAHIGNFRAYVWEDLLHRYLTFKGFNVMQVMNLTDVDDKTIKSSHKLGISLDEYTEKYKKAFFEDIDTLNIERAQVYPSATEHIDDMVQLVRMLLDKGIAYRGDDDCIYYSIAKFPGYGKLSGKRPEHLIAGARIKHDEYEKEEWADFALWKAWTPEDGDVFWETPLGKGRPGWHIECSAMSMKYLGESFDIHTGGEDNIFPHHENEIAQSEAATGKTFVRYWLHCAHLIVEGRKMSKSLGNFYTLRDLIEKGYNPLAVRYLLLATHYRQHLNFTFDGLNASQSAIERLEEFFDMLTDYSQRDILGTDRKVTDAINDGLKGFEKAMDDDLNISGALGAVFEMVRKINKISADDGITVADANYGIEAVNKLNSVIGVLKKEERKLPDELQKLIKERETARKRKNFARADEIRKKLLDMGIELKDTPDGTKWKLRKS
ncbi:cysteine--tRNA ligase [bacterium]|nr:cysteine--tRNA ligase [bacterium]